MDAIFEAAQIATPVTLEENLRRGHEAMKHVIATGRKEYRAMYRKELGWIAFSWGTPGKAPPEFKSRKEAAEWWANLPGKTNGQKGSRVFSGGRGVSRIIAKRDWEAKWMDHFAGQSGESAGGAGVPRTLHRPTHTAPFADRCCVGATDFGEAVDGMGSSAHLSHPTHAMPTVTRHDVGATDSSATVPAFAESRKPEYGTAGYGFALDI